MPPLAQLESEHVGKIVYGLAALLVILFLGFIAVSRLRRMLGRKDEAGAPGLGFSLADLRAMHRSGSLTDEEFARAKEKVVEAAKKAAERAAATTPPGAPAPRDSTDAIRARRLAREQHKDEPDEKPDEEQS